MWGCFWGVPKRCCSWSYTQLWAVWQPISGSLQAFLPTLWVYFHRLLPVSLTFVLVFLFYVYELLLSGHAEESRTRMITGTSVYTLAMFNKEWLCIAYDYRKLQVKAKKTYGFYSKVTGGTYMFLSGLGTFSTLHSKTKFQKISRNKVGLIT